MLKYCLPLQGPWHLNLVLCILNLRECWYMGLVTWHRWWHLIVIFVSKIILLQCHWSVSSKTGLLFEGHLPFQCLLPQESGSIHIQPITSLLSPRPMHYTRKLIYCGTQNNVLLPVYITTIIQIQNQNNEVELVWHRSSPSHMFGRCSN
jgi:hypothetical protein